jgi:hypothetical protein
VDAIVLRSMDSLTAWTALNIASEFQNPTAVREVRPRAPPDVNFHLSAARNRGRRRRETSLRNIVYMETIFV